MDTAAFAKCYDGNTYAAAIQQAPQDAQAVGVDSTPTSFVNGTKVLGAVPYSQIAQVIDGFLAKK